MCCIRVGRLHIFYRALDLLTSCACTDLSAGASTTALPNAAHLCRRALDFKRCRLEGMKMLRPPLSSLAPLRDQFVVLRLLHRRTTCGHRRFELLASCVHAARPLRSWVHRAPGPMYSAGHIFSAPSLARAALGRSSFPCLRGALPLSASSGAFSFILSILW